MSLDWDITNITNHDQLCFIATGEKDDDGKPLYNLNPVTDAIIWLTMMVDFVPRTEKDAREFFTRIKMWENATGSFLRQQEECWVVADLNANLFKDFEDEKAAIAAAASMGVSARVLKGKRSSDRPITWEDVKAHIGLKTNVFPESKAKFKNKLARVMREHAEKALNWQEKKLEEEKTNIDRLKEAVHERMD
jgi:hypothetical protein